MTWNPANEPETPSPALQDSQEGSRTDRPDEFSARKQAERLGEVDECAPSKTGIFRRVYAGQASPRECIKAFCLDCTGFNELAIRECLFVACPLFRLRPYQRKGSASKP
jgi:hypothetical protein